MLGAHEYLTNPDYEQPVKADDVGNIIGKNGSIIAMPLSVPRSMAECVVVDGLIATDQEIEDPVMTQVGKDCWIEYSDGSEIILKPGRLLFFRGQLSIALTASLWSLNVEREQRSEPSLEKYLTATRRNLPYPRTIEV